ncbi:uncharacterized protein LOC141856430 isoform X2 [Brevipalpus obovatus]|uniref:uncharacterized protein LOC141856430 isoform X2 n=1 Tax=Brevipalpus obovatus TaxID=246614 RepID=UPI003D9DFB12
MKAQSKNRKSPTCSRCRFHGDRDIRVLQHKCPYKDCTCSDCQLVKSNHLNNRKRSIIYKTQKSLEIKEENSNGGISSPGSGSTGSSTRCHGSPQISMNIQNADTCESNSTWFNPTAISGSSCPSANSLSSSSNNAITNNGSGNVASNSVSGPSATSISASNNPNSTTNSSVNSSSSSSSTSKNSGYSKINNFHTLCLTFPDYSPSTLQALFDQCGNDFEKTVDKILMSKWYNEPQSSDYQLANDSYQTDYSSGSASNPSIANNSGSSANSINSSAGCDDHRSSGSQPSGIPSGPHQTSSYSINNFGSYNSQIPSRMIHAPLYCGQDYPSNEEMAHRMMCSVPGPNEWMYPESNLPATSHHHPHLHHAHHPPPPPPPPHSNIAHANRYSPVYHQNAWGSSEYSNWNNNPAFWNNGHSYSSYPNHNETSGNINYLYGRREYDYQESGHHIGRSGQTQSEIGSNISPSNFDFDSY